MSTIYTNRRVAGRALAEVLARFRGRKDLLILGLPRGGVVVAFEVARALDAPLDVLVVRKVGLPGDEELAAGAVGPGGMIVLNDQLAAIMPRDVLERRIAEAQAAVARREQRLRAHLPPIAAAGRCVILVDDGIATGASMRAAVRVVRAMRPAELVLATPIAAFDALSSLRREVDQAICPATPEPLVAVGAWYDDFAEVEDREVLGLLRRARVFAESSHQAA